jgi:hypothetical protein
MTDAAPRIQWLSFVVLTTTVVGAYCSLTARVLPALRNEPASFLVLPMSVISCVTASLFYPILASQRSRSGRGIFMYFGFLVSLALYGLYLWWFIPDGKAGLVVLALLAGHMYGLPPFLTIVLGSSVLDPILFSGSATRRDSNRDGPL